LPRLPHLGRDLAPFRGEVEAHETLVLLVPAAPEPAFALQARGQPAHGALLQAQQGGELALRDSPRREQLDQGAGL
jgi:hypothetical protein